MMTSNFITAGLSVASIAFAALSVGETAVKFMTPPPIEGLGTYGRPVRPGETVIVPWVILKRTECPGVNGRAWDGENGFHLVEPLRPAALPKTSESVEYKVETQIPVLASSGKLVLRIKGYYDCPDGRVPFTLGPVVFDVIEKDIFHGK